MLKKLDNILPFLFTIVKLIPKARLRIYIVRERERERERQVNIIYEIYNKSPPKQPNWFEKLSVSGVYCQVPKSNWVESDRPNSCYTSQSMLTNQNTMCKQRTKIKNKHKIIEACKIIKGGHEHILRKLYLWFITFEFHVRYGTCSLINSKQNHGSL